MISLCGSCSRKIDRNLLLLPLTIILILCVTVLGGRFLQSSSFRSFQCLVLPASLFHGICFLLGFCCRHNCSPTLRPLFQLFNLCRQQLPRNLPVLRSRSRSLDFENDARRFMFKLDCRRGFVLRGQSRNSNQDGEIPLLQRQIRHFKRT